MLFRFDVTFFFVTATIDHSAGVIIDVNGVNFNLKAVLKIVMGDLVGLPEIFLTRSPVADDASRFIFLTCLQKRFLFHLCFTFFFFFLGLWVL